MFFYHHHHHHHRCHSVSHFFRTSFLLHSFVLFLHLPSIMMNSINPLSTPTTPTTTTTISTTVDSSSTNGDLDIQFKIGYWLSDKKCSRLNIPLLQQILERQGFQLIRIVKVEDFEQKGPFAVILHKLSDLLVKKNSGCTKAAHFLDAFYSYTTAHPETVVIDPLDKVEVLIDRYKQYRVILESELAIEDKVFTPSFVELTCSDKQTNLGALKANGVHFPFVCKPVVAHGCTLAHQMSLIFCEDGLDEIRPPCVAQSFINHSARLYKLFVIKDKYFVIERPSLKNFKAGNFPNVHYDSHDISKTNSSCELNELDEEDEKRRINRELKKKKLDRMVNVLRKKLGLCLFGIDVIIEDETGRYAIIDMNAFPGYDGVDNVLDVMADFLIEEARLAFSSSSSSANATNQERQSPIAYHAHHRFSLESSIPLQNSHNTSSNNTNNDHHHQSSWNGIKDKTSSLHRSNSFSNSTADVDSGIDTSDSCDEKKNKPSHKCLKKQYSKSLSN